MSENNELPAVRAENSLRLDLVTAFRRNRMATAGLAIVSLLVVGAVLAPWLSPYDPYAIDLSNKTLAPSASHWLGTDELGRDLLTRLIYGARISLMIGIVPALIAQIVGTSVGVVSGYCGGALDYLLMRIADVVLAFPSQLLALAIMYTLSGSLMNLFIALSVLGWAQTARVVRSLTLSLRGREFVLAARSIGVRNSVIMLRHILPNCIPTIIVLLTMRIPNYILQEASLSFLGIGAQPPTPSWGLIATKGKEYLFSAPWIGIAPGIFILVTVLGFNFMGDAVRDALDPTLKD
ncbi:MAG: ABC transporter permease [Synergistaceae bacterium]|jgi:peptide/nickel transport system permease protein/oligopeptide transport system permease protein|nr:ABC transporter permease [Synergistaceae bacterium]